MRLVAMLFVTLLVVSPVKASVYKDFVKAWDARDQTYRSERQALEASAQSAADRAVQALVSDDRFASDDLVAALTAAWSLSELVGRGHTLWELREHMANRPSAALSELWFQGKVDEVRRRQTDADLIERQIEKLKDRDTVTVRQWIAALERLSMMRGAISGTAAELVLIDQNLRSYYRARGEDGGGSAAQWQAILQALGSAERTKQDDVQQWSAQCARTGDCVRE